MKKFSKWLSRVSINGLGIFFAVMAIMFSNVQCRGKMYEPRVPEKLKKE